MKDIGVTELDIVDRIRDFTFLVHLTAEFETSRQKSVGSSTVQSCQNLPGQNSPLENST
jgi:hypothetical protein